MIAANHVGPEKGFESADNALTVLWPGGKRELARASKHVLADQLIALVAERFSQSRD